MDWRNVVLFPGSIPDPLEVPTHKLNVRPDNMVLYFSLSQLITWILSR